MNLLQQIIEQIDLLPLEEKIEAINEAKRALHKISPFKGEPVDCVVWIKNTDVRGNPYNPNSVANPEMELLRVSIDEDGYTQPIVTWMDNNDREVIDGFHRHLVGKTDPVISARVHSYLPVVTVNEDRHDQGDRMAATIRHNRARGQHSVAKMSDIVMALVKRNWSYAKISKKLGMEPDEVLRLSQISGLAEMFADKEFSEAWEAESNELITE